jgi:APA family basic amino acid/polyamine antiporter
LSAQPSKPSFMKRLFQTKNLDDILANSTSGEHQLKKTLGAMDLVVFGVGAMIGAGIFVLTGAAAAGSDGHLAAGPALTLSFILTAFICGFCALCYSEFAAMAPISGSAYTYAFSTMGEFVAWIIGWALILEYAVGNMAVSVSWTGSLKALLLNGFGVKLPTWMTSNTLDTISAANVSHLDQSIILHKIPFIIPFTDNHQFFLIQSAFNLPAFIIVMLVSCLLVIGVSESARTAAVMVFVKMFVVILFIGVGAFYFMGGHWPVLHQNWFAHGWKSFAPNGFSGIITGASTIIFAYIGFDAVSTAAEETKNPQRDIPIGILGSLAICTLLYIAVTAIITGVMPLKDINQEAAVVGAMNYMGYPWASWLISGGTIAGLTSVLLVLQMGGIRILYAIARDGLLPKSLAAIHPKYKTPHICSWITGLFVALGSGLLPITLLAEMCNIGTLAAFVIVCVGVAILRFTEPDRKRPFRAPFGLLFPILGSLGCCYVMTGLPIFTWLVTIGWFALGMLVYFCYGFWHSSMHTHAADFPLDAPKLG